MPELLAIFLLLLLNGFFAAAEIAIVAARKGRLKQLAAGGDRKAAAALDLHENPSRFLPTVQLCLTVIGTAAAALGGARLVTAVTPALTTVFGGAAEKVAFVAVVLGITFFEVLIGEIVPKRLALRDPSGLARLVALPMAFVAKIVWPVVWAMEHATNALLRMVGFKPEDKAPWHLEDFEQALDEGVADGTLEHVEKQVAKGALRLGERVVHDIMHPRVDIDGLALDTPANEILGAVAMAGFSRLPVYDGDLDHIVGFVHVKDVLRQVQLGWSLDLAKLVRPALLVHEGLTLDKLLLRFREERTHMAVVIDEHGGTEGIVTLDAVLEELVGDIGEGAKLDAANAIVQRADGTWLVDGAENIEDVLEQLGAKGVKLPALRGYTTVAGLALEQFGRIPKVGDAVAWEGFRIEVLDMDGARIDRLLFAPAGE